MYCINAQLISAARDISIALRSFNLLQDHENSFEYPSSHWGQMHMYCRKNSHAICYAIRPQPNDILDNIAGGRAMANIHLTKGLLILLTFTTSNKYLDAHLA